MKGARRRALERSLNLGVKAGQFVSWPASSGQAKGKVVSLHTAKVPGVVAATTATAEAPAARVRLWTKSGSAWSSTSVDLAIPVASLTTIDDLPEAPTPSAAATEAVAGSFDDIRCQVRDAICDRIEQMTGVCPSIYLYDCGIDWAVYELNWDDDLWMVSYSMTDAGVVLGEPVEVARVVTYEPVMPDPADASQVAAEAHERFEGRLLEAKAAASDGGRVFRVRIIQAGMSKNGRRYTESVLASAVPLYEGAKAFDHHRTAAELISSTIDGLIGHYENVALVGGAIEGDLHLLPSATHAAEALDQALANQTLGLPPLVGISHDAAVKSKAVVEGGRQLQEITAITQVYSADVVADPAAGGEAMRQVAGGIDPDGHPTPPTPNRKVPTVTLKQLLTLLRAAESAERAGLLQEHASVIEAAGLTVADIERMLEAAVPNTDPTPMAKGSLLTAVAVREAVKAAALDDRLAESVLAELPDQFTEAHLNQVVARTKRIAEAAALKPDVPHVDTVFDSMDKKVAALDAMLAGKAREGYPSLKHAYVDITGHEPRWSDTEDFNRRILRESASFTPTSERASESVQASSWGYVLGDSVARRMVAEYQQPALAFWRLVVSSIFPVQDFRTQRLERLGGYGVLPAVNEGAPYQPLTSPGNDAEPTYVLAKKGGTEDLTLETIANDDLRAVRRIPIKLGLAAAQTIFRYVFDILNTNPSVYDSTNLFAAGHNNTATNSLSGANLSVARKAMRKQTAYGDSSDVLSIVPKFLITCSDLEELAWELCTSAVALPSGAPVGAATNIPNLHQGLTPLVVDYWSSSTTWFTVADPALIPTIEMGFYQGREDPELFVQADPLVGSAFNADKITWKIRHIYAGAVVDYRGFYRGNT